MLEKIAKAKVLILGFGVEGKATLAYLQEKFPEKEFAVADRQLITDFDKSPLRGLGGVKPQFEEDFSTAPRTNLNFNERGSGRNDAILEKIRTFFGEDYLKYLDQFDLIIKSPGIKPDLPELVEFKKNGGEVTSATNLFMSQVQGTVIGVTGSKGKSTVSSLLYAILKQAGKKVFLIGNIGNPALEELKNDSPETFFVYEMSSYQIEDLHYKPQYVIINNLFPEHLDYHGSISSYYNAKMNIITKEDEANEIINYKLKIINNQKDILQENDKNLNNVQVRDLNQPFQQVFYNAGSEELRGRMERGEGRGEKGEGRKVAFNDGENSKIEDGKLIYRGEKIVDIKDVKLLGKHNLENILGVIAVSWELGVGSEEIRKAVQNFTNLEHRLEFVGEFQRIKFYNDSISTTPESTIRAIEAFGEMLDTLILGGLDRGYDFTELAEVILKSKIRNLILFPETGGKILTEIQNSKLENPPYPLYQGGLNTFFVDNMADCVRIAFDVTEQGKICLLSPASPSYNLFKNFIERGNLYKKFVKELQN